MNGKTKALADWLEVRDNPHKAERSAEFEAFVQQYATKYDTNRYTASLRSAEIDRDVMLDFISRAPAELQPKLVLIAEHVLTLRRTIASAELEFGTITRLIGGD